MSFKQAISVERIMRPTRLFCPVLAASICIVQSVSAQQILDCPDPLFECIGPGPGGNPPGDPPGPILEPVHPLIELSVDFNNSYGIVRNGQMTIASGTPTLTDTASNYLSENRLSINPNAVYALSPSSITESIDDTAKIIVGGGALSQ